MLKFMIPRYSTCTNRKALNAELSIKIGESRIFPAYEIEVGNEMNRPFATNDHMVHGGGQAHYYSHPGTLKQRDLNQCSLTCLCFDVPVRE